MNMLVLGATGRVGRLVLAELLASGQAVRAMVRDPARAATALGKTPDPKLAFVAGDFGDAASLARACEGMERVFLVSPVSEHLAAHQAAVVEAARRSGVKRLVKLSGSAWTMLEGSMTETGAQHRAVERALQDSGVGHAVIRPNAFMHGALDAPVLALKSGDELAIARGTARAGYIHVADIAACCAQALLAPAASNALHEITGPASLSGEDIAAAASALLGRTIRYRAVPLAAAVERLRAQGMAGYLLRHAEENSMRVARGDAAMVTAEVQHLLGRPARGIGAFIAETLGIAR